MAEPETQITLVQKLDIFRACFTGLRHCYGTYDPRTGRAYSCKQPVTDEVLVSHLQGRQPYGVYLLVGDMTTAVVADFDEEDTQPPVEFARAAARCGISVYVERSKKKGWHVWLFLAATGSPAAKARAVVKLILAGIGKPSTEIFPKQDRLVDGSQLGNFINSPMYGALAPKGRTVFVDIDRGLSPFPDQWGLLRGVRRVSEMDLDRIIGTCNPPAPAQASTAIAPRRPALSSQPRYFGLPACARRMLNEGVSANQRVACFHLALQLRKAGVPEYLATACLLTWATRNHPGDGKGIISGAEIAAQTRAAYLTGRLGCGCEQPVVMEFCDPTCPIYRGGQATPGPSNQQPTNRRSCG